MATKTPQKSTAESTFSLISNSKLQQMYSTMLQYRILESHARKIIGGKASMRGREAMLVGSAIDLQDEDALAIANDAGIASFLKKAPLSSILGQLQKRKAGRGKTKAKQRRVALASASDAAHGSIATGIALANSRAASSNVTLAVMQNTTDHAGTFAFAREHKLPIIYVINGFDEAEAQSYGFPVIPVDGNDVVAVYRVAYECILRARQGGGPSMLACIDFPLALSVVKSRDPLRNMERYLTGKGLFTENWKRQLIQSFERELRQSLAAAKKAARGKQQSGRDDRVFSI